LTDATSGANHVTYSYSRFYGNNVAQFPTSDVVGGIAGSGNISSLIPPVAVNFRTYPARFSFTVDDVGSSYVPPGTEAYINTFLTMFTTRGLYFNAAVVPSYTVDWISVNNWYAAGNEIDSHSWSHQYYSTNTDPCGTPPCSPPYPNYPALDMQYTGSGTAATLTISGNTLSTTVTGASGDSIPSVNLTVSPYNTLTGLLGYLAAVPHYTVTQDNGGTVVSQDGIGPLVRPNTHTTNLLNVSTQDIKTASFKLVYDQTKLEPDEMTSSKNAIQSNVTGLTETFYVYPAGIEDPSIELNAVAAGYTAARGSLSMKDQANETQGANSLYSNGVNVQNLTSLGAIQIHGLTQAQINQMAASLVFRAAAWGAPYGFFTHWNSRGDLTPDISNTELGYLLDAITANGGVWLTNLGLASAVTSGTGISGTTRWVQNPTGAAVNLAVAGANSPTVGRGVATAYAIDLHGMNRSALGAWDVGASAYLSQRYGEGTGAGTTHIGGFASLGLVQLPQNWVNSNERAGTTSNAISFPATGTGGGWACGSTNYGPYTAGSQASLQQAVNDAESCRTANGSGTTITIPPAVYSGSNGLTLPQTAGDASSNFIVLTSTSPLPTGQTVCSHGIQDNVSESTQPGIRNLGCNGTNLSYQLGTTVNTVSAGAFTLANGTATNTSAYNDVASMWTVECTGSNCNAISTATWDANNVGPHHYAILNAELRPQAGLTGPAAPFATGQSAETILSQLPSHIHLAYSYLHGDWTDAPVSGGVATNYPTGANAMPNGVALNGCIYCSLAYNYMDRAIRPGGEGHGMALLLAQQIKIVHNWFEGQSSGALCGGQGSQIPIAGFVGCTDVEDRANRYTYPYSWMLAAAAGLKPNGGTNSYVRKNGHELKVGERYLFDGNIVENVDDSGAQNGTIISFKTDNTNSSGNNYWVIDENTTITNNVLRNSCNGPSLGYRSNSAGGDGGGTALPTQFQLYANNLLYGYGVTLPGCSGVSPQFGFRLAQIGTSAVWAGVTAQRDATGTFVTLTLPSSTSPELTVSSTNVGDPVNVSGCTDATFNTGNAVLGPPALAGTLVNGLTVEYANAGTANATTTGCTYNNGQGWPNFITFTHNSDFSTNASYSNDPSSSSNGGTNPYAFARNMTFTNSIIVGGGVNSTFAEGTRSQTKAMDATTEVFNNVLLAGRDAAVTCPGHGTAGAGGMAACYTEYSSTHVAATPVTLYGVPNSYCTGSDPTVGSCSGILGAMSTSAFPVILNDWHQYRLCHAGDAPCNNNASLYAGGGTYQASDGTDLGVAAGAIDAAETRNIYFCASACGLTGPYADH